jgi:putative protease
MEEMGEVTHYYARIGVAVVRLRASLSLGERILIKGATTHLEQDVASMQIEHSDITRARAGQSIGIKVEGKVRAKDKVYRKP